MSRKTASRRAFFRYGLSDGLMLQTHRSEALELQVARNLTHGGMAPRQPHHHFKPGRAHLNGREQLAKLALSKPGIGIL